MSTGHFVSHAGTRFSPKTCWRAGCNRPATDGRNARFYCPAHYEPKPITPNFDHVLTAHRMMTNTRGGLSLSDIAGRLRMGTSALDRALWTYIGRKA